MENNQFAEAIKPINNIILRRSSRNKKEIKRLDPAEEAKKDKSKSNTNK
jgi:hypothetical protein